MPAHKRSWSDSVHGEDPRDQQFSHQDAKQSRTEREPKTEIEEEEEEEEQREQLKEGEREDEGREEDQGEEEKQHNKLEEATGARGYVTCIPFHFFLDFFSWLFCFQFYASGYGSCLVYRLLKLFRVFSDSEGSQSSSSEEKPEYFLLNPLLLFLCTIVISLVFYCSLGAGLWWFFTTIFF